MSEDSLSKLAGIKKEDDNLLFIGCSPCQYWSVITGNEKSAKKDKAHKTRNLLRDFLRFVRHYRPGFVLIENVRGVKRTRKKAGCRTCVNFWNKTIFSFKEEILSASDYGVPQTRRRYVLLASRVVRNINRPRAKAKPPRFMTSSAMVNCPKLTPERRIKKILFIVRLN